jgi:3-hydroxyisobutyrate dehydrogenase
MQDNHRIGWVCTGRMGAAMATRLINAGTDVTVWNRTAANAAPLLESGATQADTIAAVVLPPILLRVKR